MFFIQSYFNKLFNEVTLNKIDIHIEFLNKDLYDADSRACFFVCENKLYIMVNVEDILKIKTFKDDKTWLKTLLFNFLHELNHVIICITESIKTNKIFEESYNKNNEYITELINKIKEENPDFDGNKMLISRLIPEELECDYFAFEHLHTILNIYNYNELL